MRQRVQFGRVVALIAALCPLMLRAQDQAISRPDSGVESKQTQTTGSNATQAAGTETAGSQESQGTRYVGSLNGSGLIAMEDSADQHILLSLTGSGGWDSNPDNTQASSVAGVYSLSPYIGYMGASARSQYIAQYQPTIMGYTSDGYVRQTLQSASGSLLVAASERLKLELNASGSYGSNGTRLLSNPQTIVVGDVAGTSAASSASYLKDSGNVTNIAGSVNANYRSSDRNTIAVTGSTAYSRTSGLNQEGGIANLTGTFTRDISQTFWLNGYAQAGHYYGDLQYETYGVGAGFGWRPAEGLSLSLDAGPQISTCGCGGTKSGVAYTVSFGARLTNRSQMYLLSDHRPTVSYLGPSLWERSTSGGFQYSITPIGVIRGDVGYISSDTLTAATSYRGTSWGADYSVYLRHGFAVAYSYRGYATNTSGVGTIRNLGQVSITWTHRAGQIFQTGD